MRLALMAAAAGLVWWGVFVLGFLAEPSAVGNMRTGLILIGVGSLTAGAACAATATWMLLARRT